MLEGKLKETKAAKFSRLASARTSKAIKTIRRIGILSAKSRYEYSPEQAAKITAALAAEVEAIAERFSPPSTTDFSV